MVLKHVCSTKSPLQGVGGEEKKMMINECRLMNLDGKRGLENSPPPSPLKCGASSPLKMGTKVAEDIARSQR